ncbi:MAG TPA: MFS transporter [Phycisphaerales bacterium]|nr:MFS transporter [Phycisphaerales bacterium]
MKRNVFLLAFAQAMMMTGNSLIVATSSLVGFLLAEDKSLATIPLALQFLATMLSSIPASFIMQRIGRRNGFVLGLLLGGLGAATAVAAILGQDFWLFCVATLLVGMFNGFGIYYRFAAADVASETYKARAISYVMAGGVVAAFIGPNLANWTNGIMGTPEFAGSYAALLGIYALSLIALFFLDIPRPGAQVIHAHGRPLRAIASQPAFVVAVLAGMLGYGIMVLVMTATPLAMKGHAHSFSDTAFVIQWHVFGMFAPSFFTGALIQRFGVLNVLLWGALLNLACVGINFLGTDVWHFWLALFLLGVGWNFLFVGATSLLTETYTEVEKAKTQALNDFIVFTTVTVASLSAGWLQHHYGWQAVNAGVLPSILVILMAVLWLRLRRVPVPATG